MFISRIKTFLQFHRRWEQSFQHEKLSEFLQKLVADRKQRRRTSNVRSLRRRSSVESFCSSRELQLHVNGEMNDLQSGTINKQVHFWNSWLSSWKTDVPWTPDRRDTTGTSRVSSRQETVVLHHNWNEAPPSSSSSSTLGPGSLRQRDGFSFSGSSPLPRGAALWFVPWGTSSNRPTVSGGRGFCRAAPPPGLSPSSYV